MNKEINKIIANLEGCIGMFDYLLTPIESNLLVSYIKELQLKELQQENQELKKQLENCFCNRTDCSGRIKDSKTYYSLEQKIENQQKEFIYYLERTIEELECDDVDDEEMKGYLFQRKDTFKEILSKYYEIIGGKDE